MLKKKKQDNKLQKLKRIY